MVQKGDGALAADPNGPQVAKAIGGQQEKQRKTAHKHERNRRITVIIAILVLLLAGAGAGYATYRWSQTRYYVGESNGKVAIFQGVPTNIFGFSLSHEVERTSISTSDLPQTWRDELTEGITRDNLDEARAHVKYLRSENDKLNSKDAGNSGDSKDSGDASKGGAKDSSQRNDSSGTTGNSGSTNSKQSEDKQ